MTAMTPNTIAITGIILAGGRGERFNKRDKGWIEWQDKAFIEHAVERLRPQLDDIIISCNRNTERYQRLGYRICTDATDTFDGPLAGISAGLGLSTTPTTLVVPCDAPLLPLNLSARLSSALNAQTADICYCHDGDRDQYLFALISTSLQPSLAAYLASGQRSVKDWYALHRTVAVDFSGDALAFTNVNSPPDQRALENSGIKPAT